MTRYRSGSDTGISRIGCVVTTTPGAALIDGAPVNPNSLNRCSERCDSNEPADRTGLDPQQRNFEWERRPTGNRLFESVSLQRRVSELSVPPCGNRRERARVSAEPAATYVSVRSRYRREGRR